MLEDEREPRQRLYLRVLIGRVLLGNKQVDFSLNVRIAKRKPRFGSEVFLDLNLRCTYSPETEALSLDSHCFHFAASSSVIF